MKHEIYKIIRGDDISDDILEQAEIALVCSIECPPDIPSMAYEQVKQFRKQGRLIISGFHSPVEKECRRILLDSPFCPPRPAIWCPAYGEGKPLSDTEKAATKDGRLVVVYLFPAKDTRANVRRAKKRNRWLSDKAKSVFIPHASAGGKTDKLCRSLLESDKQLFTIDHPDNRTLLELGARPVEDMDI